MASSEGFPAADVQRELNPGLNKDFQVDPISSDVAASKEIQNKRFSGKESESNYKYFICPSLDEKYKADCDLPKNSEQIEAMKKVREQEKKDAMQSFKTAIIVSGIVVAIAGAVFAIAKKLREK